MPVSQPDPGHVYFYDHAKPPLTAGDYQLQLSQHYEVDKDGSTSSQNVGPQTTQDFTIVGPRFNLNPADIHSVWPPHNGDGPFINRLPQIVLTRRTLPWERKIADVSEFPWATNAPWMTLLVFKESEVTLLDPPDTTLRLIYNEANDPYVEKYKPAGVTSTDLNQGCIGVEVALDVFQEIAPMGEELEYLTHVRQVNTDDKELLGMDQDGWFAVSISNRLLEPGTKYVACLVSLEGLSHLLPEDVGATDNAQLNPIAQPATGIGDKYTLPSVHYGGHGFGYVLEDSGLVFTLPERKIRLLTLARWQFNVSDIPGDFESLMVNLPHRGGVAMLGMNKNTATAEGAKKDVAYQVALDSGHVPLKHITREGETTVAWYRGPLVPLGVNKDNKGPYHTADQARRIDPQTGLENLGYAAAFEIGRLMALADPRFALELLRWRRNGQRKVNSEILHHGIDTDILNIMEQFVERHVAEKMLNTVYRDILTGELMGPLADPTGLKELGGLKPGLDPLIQIETAPGEFVLMADILNTGATLEGGGGFIDVFSDGGSLDLISDLDILQTNDGLQSLDHLQQALGDLLNNGGAL